MKPRSQLASLSASIGWSAVVGLLLTTVLFVGKVSGQPAIRGLLELAELRKHEQTTLHITLYNPSPKTIRVSDLSVVTSAFAVTTTPEAQVIILTPLQTETAAFVLRATRPGEAVIALRVRWSSANASGELVAPVGRVRIKQTRPGEVLETFLGGAAVLAILGLIGNAYLSWLKRKWDSQAAASARRDELVRRMTEQVHIYIQTHYQTIASWAHSFAFEAGKALKAETIEDSQAQYLAYLLARLVNLEDAMQDKVGGYFLRDQTAEGVLITLRNQVDSHITQPGLLDDEGFSAFV